jgi:hypothetical protein
MQPLARGQVDIDSQALLQETLAGDQVKCVEFAARVIVDEQVEVALGASLIPGRRPEQVKRGCTPRPQRTGETT